MRRWLWLGLGLYGCSSSEPGQQRPAPTDAGVTDTGLPEVLYYRDVKPIVDGRCGACHVSGGIAPIDLTVPAVVQSAANLIKPQVEQRLMPPWHAGQGCNTFKNDRSLTQAQIDTLLKWIELGTPMGDPNMEGPPLDPLFGGLSRTDLKLSTPAPYTPTGTDDYRCFVVEWPEQSTKFVSGMNLEPSNPGVVHHANLYIGGPGAGADSFRDQDAAAPGPGYPCFGGAFTPGVALLGSWAPGSSGIQYPGGTGIQIEPGSVIVMEMHFNTGEGRDGPDQSTLVLQLENAVDRPAVIVPFWDFDGWSGNRTMDIPAGETDVMHNFQITPDLGLLQLLAPWLTDRNLLFHGAGLHMHFLGTSGRISVIRDDGNEDCVLEIPRWDFSWQYGYLHSEPIPFLVGSDQLYLECHWDNSPGNQPIIDGVRRQATDVNWGSGSGDEMCIGYLYVTAE